MEAARAAPVASILVVTGADPAVAAHVQAWGGAHLVMAEDHAQGLSASLRAGVAALPADAAGALVLLGDMPLVPHAVLAPLVQVVSDGAPAAAPVWGGRLGNPVCLSASLFPQILALDGDRGARPILDALGKALARIPAPTDGVLIDVDRPQDLPS
jgi:molybdenum cofactor cytidylyltransferase